MSIGKAVIRPMMRALNDAPVFFRQLAHAITKQGKKNKDDKDNVQENDRFDGVDSGSGTGGSDAQPPTRYRNDSRSPETIFEDGFQPRDPSNNNLEDYVVNHGQSNFVSTTKDPTLYQRPYFQQGAENYRFQIQDPGGGIDVNEVFPGNPHWDEFEIAYPGGVGREHIIGAQRIGSDGVSLGDFIPNPFFGGGK